MVDVGEATRAFLRRPAASALLRSFAGPMRVEASQAIDLLSFLAATHDIGKVSPGFQAKRLDLAPKSPDLPYRATIDETDHGRVGLAALGAFLRDRGLDVPAAMGIARALGAHHGAFPAPVALGRSPGGAGWQAARSSLLEALERAYRPDWASVKILGQPSAEWLMSLAGLVSVCDWIGSAEELFPWDQAADVDLSKYLPLAADRAERALVRLGFSGWSPRSEPLPFTQVFGFAPNDMQAAATRAAEELGGPGLILVEAPMGLGKTEAALAAADVLIRRFNPAGLYYALPTQATSNQMFGRVCRFLEKRYAGVQVDLHLLHGLSDLNKDYSSLRLSAIGQDSDATVRASAWFGAAKRGLLAPFGVGTIDQALLAVLSVRHVFVRLLGLAQKVVVLDEVHAYDTYMSELLDHLLGWLAALGSSVILLSATLPPRRRAALLTAYAGPEAHAPDAAYPSLTVVERHAPAVAVGLPAGKPSVVALERWPTAEGDGPDAVAGQILARLTDGGCAAWICNTVGGAQQAFEAVRRASAGGECEVELFHARFPTGSRLAIERRCLVRYGRGGARPRRSVLVATQVVEQSLDLDFDLMVSDLAPVDLLLQRAGRLHRHAGRSRPAGLSRPTLAWLDVPLLGGVPDLGVHGVVYDPYVLLRTWAALRDRREVLLPPDVAALVGLVYGEGDLAQPGPLAEAIVAARRSHDRAVAEDARKAMGIEIKGPDEFEDLAEAAGLMLDEDESPRVHETLKARTRLTRPSITLVCASQQGGDLLLHDGTRLDLDRPLTREHVLAARLSSVAVQRWEWFAHLRGQAVPEPWRRSAALRDCRLGVFRDGALAAPGLRTRLILSPDLGLVIENVT